MKSSWIQKILGLARRSVQVRKMPPFIDIRDTERIRLAHTILSYPHEYCLKVKNQERLERLLPRSDGTLRLLEMLKETQSALASHLPLPFDTIWSLRDSLRSDLVPTTTSIGSVVAKIHTDTLAGALNRHLLEEVLETMPSVATGTITPDGIGLALASYWLSEHAALVALGLAEVHLAGTEQIIIQPKGPEAITHFRRLWFASAFEESSLRKAQMSLEVYADLAGGAQGLTGDVETAFYEALSIIPQHWRLPVDEGPVARLFSKHLWPLVWLAGNVFNAARHKGQRPIFRADMPNDDYGRAFDDVAKDQSSRKLFDRVFDIRDGGLVLGPRKLAPGLLLIAEQMAYAQIGPGWHDKDLSDTQKKYLIGRLESIPHVEVIELEIAKHDTADETHVDVDLFVRDTRQNCLYAVQLKHLEYSDKGGMRCWISRFARSDKGLAYGVAQLEAFKSLAKSDPTVKEKLLNRGIEAKELEHVVPVLLHNIGILDCLAFQAGILVYDQNTFVNVLDGRPAIGVGVVNGQAVHVTRRGDLASCRLDDPDSVISAYVGDPHFALAHFDVAASVTRRLSILGSSVQAEGLGI